MALCCYRKIHMLPQRFIRASLATGPVYFDITRAGLVKRRFAITGAGMRANRESIVKDMLTIQIPLQADRASLPAGIDSEGYIDCCMYLKSGSRYGSL